MEGRKVVIEVPEDLDAYEMADELKCLMYFMTYHPDSVNKVFNEE